MPYSYTGPMKGTTTQEQAGHAVLAWTFGLEIGDVHIIPDDGCAGMVKILSWDEFDEPLLRARALTTLAGEVTEEIRTGTPADWSEFRSTPGALLVDVCPEDGAVHRLGTWRDRTTSRRIGSAGSLCRTHSRR